MDEVDTSLRVIRPRRIGDQRLGRLHLHLADKRAFVILFA
jgi:hypothetical protein